MSNMLHDQCEECGVFCDVTDLHDHDGRFLCDDCVWDADMQAGHDRDAHARQLERQTTK